MIINKIVTLAIKFPITMEIGNKKIKKISNLFKSNTLNIFHNYIKRGFLVSNRVLILNN